jgi:hypothetical protein
VHQSANRYQDGVMIDLTPPFPLRVSELSLTPQFIKSGFLWETPDVQWTIMMAGRSSNEAIYILWTCNTTIIKPIKYQEPYKNLYLNFSRHWNHSSSAEKNTRLKRALCINYYKLPTIRMSLRYKPEGRGFDSWWCNWNFSLT